MTKSGQIGLAVIFLAAGVLTYVSTSANWRGREPEMRVVKSVPDESWKNQKWIKDYQLTERSGRLFDSQELAGQVHVVSFFFASCPGPCFKQNTALAAVHKEFAKRGVKFLSITCDPDNDTPAALHQYARKFDADPEQWLFLTGELPLIRRVGTEVYRVPLDKESHVESFFVYDKAGEQRGKFHWNQPREIADMKQMLAKLIDEPVGAKKPADAAAAKAQADSKETVPTDESNDAGSSKSSAASGEDS